MYLGMGRSTWHWSVWMWIGVGIWKEDENCGSLWVVAVGRREAARECRRKMCWMGTLWRGR